MITLAHPDLPEISIERLGESLQVGKTWYNVNTSHVDPDPHAIA